VLASGASSAVYFLTADYRDFIFWGGRVLIGPDLDLILQMQQYMLPLGKRWHLPHEQLQLSQIAAPAGAAGITIPMENSAAPKASPMGRNRVMMVALWLRRYWSAHFAIWVTFAIELVGFSHPRRARLFGRSAGRCATHTAVRFLHVGDDSWFGPDLTLNLLVVRLVLTLRSCGHCGGGP
jgi:hypothetical protein